MNYAQFGMFIIFFFSVLFCGLAIYSYINRNGESFVNYNVFLGEGFLMRIGTTYRVRSVPIEEFAREVLNFERKPKNNYYEYGFLEELTSIN